MKKIVPLKEIAHWLDLTPRRVQQLAKEGIIPKAGHGRYDLMDCVQGYIRYLRELSGTVPVDLDSLDLDQIIRDCLGDWVDLEVPDLVDLEVP